MSRPFALSLACTALVLVMLPTRGAGDDDDDDAPSVFQEQARRARFEEANRLRAEADKLYQQGNYRKVIEVANRLLQDHGDDNVHVAYHLRASAKIELGRQQQSGMLVREGINDALSATQAANGKHLWTYIPYLYGLTSLAEIEKRPEHAEAAITWVAPILKRATGPDFSPDDKANLYYQRALAHLARRNHQNAVNDLDEAIKLSAGHLAAHLKRAQTLAQMDQFDNASKAFDLAVERFPNAAVTYNERGGFRRRRGNLEGAIDDFSRAVQLEPRFALGYINRALCLIDQGTADAAEHDLEQALQLRPEPAAQALAFRLRGAARLGRGASAAAIADYDAAARLAPKEAQILEERGVARFCRKSFEAAAADFEAAMKLDVSARRLLPWRAAALLRAGKRVEAQRLVDTASAGPRGSEWPSRLSKLLVGREQAEALRDLAAGEEARLREFRLLELAFFEAQSLRLAGNAEEAEARFKDLSQAGMKAPWLARVARYELGELQ